MSAPTLNSGVKAWPTPFASRNWVGKRAVLPSTGTSPSSSATAREVRPRRRTKRVARSSAKEETVKVKDVFFMLMVQDMERGVRFYRDVLGLDVKDQTPEWSRLALGDKIIVLRGGITGGLTWTGLHFEVEDIQDACLRVQEGGGRILGWPHRANGWTALADLADTEGNEFTFYSPPE